MDGASAGLDHGLHQLKRVEHAAKTGFGIGHDGREVIDEVLIAGVNAFGVLDFVSTAEGVVHTLHNLGHRVHGVQRLVRVHRRVGVVVSGNLPARQVNRLHAGFDLLHGLATGERAQGVDVRLRVQQVPELFGTAAGQGVLDRK